MTASRNPAQPSALVSKVVDYEPAPIGTAACRSTTTLRNRTPRDHRPLTRAPEPVPPRAAVVFADAALRRVLEVVDRRRPVAQVRPLLAPSVIDSVIALLRAPHAGGNALGARLHRIRLRMTPADRDVMAAEVFGTYTRGARVLAVAARIEHSDDRWRIVALQLG
jgi:hypothetical protein